MRVRATIVAVAVAVSVAVAGTGYILTGTLRTRTVHYANGDEVLAKRVTC